MTEAYLNSKFVGTVDDPNSFVAKVRDERRAGNIVPNLNI